MVDTGIKNEYEYINEGISCYYGRGCIRCLYEATRCRDTVETLMLDVEIITIKAATETISAIGGLSCADVGSFIRLLWSQNRFVEVHLSEPHGLNKLYMTSSSFHTHTHFGYGYHTNFIMIIIMIKVNPSLCRSSSSAVILVTYFLPL